ncbi:hypothetical protein [Gordonia rubripertincta]|uniref:hypothetical protein n=1 Tax=Gordonia rubripertincta TaxID=36822 RepID=UPI0015FBCFF8|nr:hypothetical protein [Gordonia rubripertincta]QMU22056.1 hypothetical protein H3V45_06075 [Gordonia rubripertincta]
MSTWWDVLGALALSVSMYWASSRAGHRWAEWRDLRRQEREIDRAARAIPDEERFGDWRGPAPLPPTPTVRNGRAASMVPLILNPDSDIAIEDLGRAMGLADLGEDEQVRG